MIYEAIFIVQWTQGALSFRDVMDMAWPEREDLLENAVIAAEGKNAGQ